MADRLAAQVVIPEATLEVTAVAGSKAVSAPEFPRGKYLVGVQPTRLHTVTTACRGGIYLRVSEVVNNLASRRHRRRVVWAGSYRDGHIPASIPNLRCKVGTQFVAEAWSLVEFNGEKIEVQLTFDDVPCGGTYIHEESPREGPGQIVVVALGDAAAGAEVPTTTIPALEAWDLLALGVTLVTSAVAGNRTLRVAYDDGANVYAGASESGSTPASSTTLIRLARGAQIVTTTSTHIAALPYVTMNAGHRVSFATANLDAGDNFGPAFAEVEKWVMPDG